MRKVAGRLEVLEERYKDLPPKQRAGKINEELMNTFCVGEREIRQWKRIVHVAKQDAEHMFREQYMHSRMDGAAEARQAAEIRSVPYGE